MKLQSNGHYYPHPTRYYGDKLRLQTPPETPFTLLYYAFELCSYRGENVLLVKCDFASRLESELFIFRARIHPPFVRRDLWGPTDLCNVVLSKLLNGTAGCHMHSVQRPFVLVPFFFSSRPLQNKRTKYHVKYPRKYTLSSPEFCSVAQ